MVGVDLSDGSRQGVDGLPGLVDVFLQLQLVAHPPEQHRGVVLQRLDVGEQRLVLGGHRGGVGVVELVCRRHPEPHHHPEIRRCGLVEQGLGVFVHPPDPKAVATHRGEALEVGGAPGSTHVEGITLHEEPPSAVGRLQADVSLVERDPGHDFFLPARFRPPGAFRAAAFACLERRVPAAECRSTTPAAIKGINTS